MKIGSLYYDNSTERMYITFEDGSYSDGLHCGETLEALKDNQWTNATWVQTRIEADVDSEWYLVGLCNGGEIPVGQIVRRFST